MKEFVIQKNDANQRLDKFISKAAPLLPPSMMYKAIRTKDIKVNGKRAEISTRLQEGDVVRLFLKDEFFAEARKSAPEFMHAGNALNVIYEDENIIIVDKPGGLTVHEDESHRADTLINRILKYLYQKREYDPEKESSFTPALCNRIDRNTMGLVLCAKNAATLQLLNEKIRDREITKEYRCIVVGKPEPPEAVCKAFLTKGKDEKQVKIHAKPSPDAKTVITEYRTLRSNGTLTELEVTLHTGRTHQIRAHMAYLGWPLLGDTKYGNAASCRLSKQMKLTWQALCAWRITFSFADEGGHLSYLRGRSFTSGQNLGQWF